MRKQGVTFLPEEEALKKKLEEITTDLNSPTQFKGRLNELLSQIRLHKSYTDPRTTTKYNVDATALGPVKEFLSIQQESVKHLVSTTKTDLETLKEMMDGLTNITSKV
jgi:nuclear pore complex protein Nup54